MTFVEDSKKRMAMKPIIFVLLILCLYLQNGVSVKINHKRQKYLTNSEFFLFITNKKQYVMITIKIADIKVNIGMALAITNFTSVTV